MNSFFRELKQRKVYRVALGYAVGYGVLSTTETVSFRGIFDVEPFESRGW